MVPRDYRIHPVGNDELDALMTYLEDQLSDNGSNGVPLFQPQARGAAWRGAEKLALFRDGLAVTVGRPHWRRAWVARDLGGAIAGHVDLRAHPEATSTHRALLGMGVHREHRRRGVARALVEHALTWATTATVLEWIDLTFLAGNTPAERLYAGIGFQTVVTIPDMFRIDGQSIDETIMTKRIRA